MPTLIAAATNNFTDSGTWATVDATALLDSEAGNTALTTSYVLSSTFTPGAITIDGIAVKLASRAAGSPSNTISVALDLATVTVTGTEVTINVSDIDACSTASNEGGWYLFKFAAPVLLVGATAYSVKAKLSATTTAVNLYRDGTAGNWSRLLRTTTAASPGAGDTMHVVGEHTGAGTGNSFTVTMQETATTDYGSGTDGTPGLTIGKRGTLTYGTTAATNYYLKLSGDLLVYSSGTLNIGTTGTPMPRDSTAVLEFDPVADGGMGLIIRAGTVNIQGQSRTSGKNIFTCVLNTNEAANSTSLGVDTDTGWLDNDVIVVASTTRTASETERGTLNGDAGASTLTVDGFAGASGGLLNAHGGVSPVIAEIILITRNVKVRSATSTIMAYVFASAAATVDIDWAEFRYLGENATNKRGIECATTSAGSFSIQFSALYDFEDGGFYAVGASGSVTFSSNVCDQINTVNGALAAVSFVVTSGAHSIQNNIFLRLSCGSNSVGNVNIADLGSTFTGNVIAGSLTVAIGALGIQESGVENTGNYDNNTCHSNASVGFWPLSNNGMSKLTATGWKTWRNNSFGLHLGNALGASLTLINFEAFGNVNQNIQPGGGSRLTLINPTINGGATLVAPSGIVGPPNTQGIGQVFIFGGSFVVTTAHSTADINCNASGTGLQCIMFGTTLATSTEVATQSNLAIEGGFIKSHQHDASTTTHKSWYRAGTVQSDQTIRHTASGYSWKLTPNSSIFKLRLPGPGQFDTFNVPVNASSEVIITAYVYKDASYNGNAPRLVVVGGIVGGVGSAGADVTDSLTVADSTWEQLSIAVTPSEVGVLECYVDCDGTAGNVYVDDFGVSQA